MDLAIGIDVGFKATGRSTGVVILDRSTQMLAAGSKLNVSSGAGALSFVLGEIQRLKPASAIFCIDGPFAPAQPGAKVRLVERFFMSGPFGSTPPPKGLGLRISPAPTSQTSKFLASTRLLVNTLVAAGVAHMTVAPPTVTGDIIEIFPTIFMAALLPLQAYTGSRSAHTDEQWLKLIGAAPASGFSTIHPALAPYHALVTAVEASPKGDLHDLRTAAMSAIAADWYAAAPPGSQKPNSTVFVGHLAEYGFILPPRSLWDPSFVTLMNGHQGVAGGPPLIWI